MALYGSAENALLHLPERIKGLGRKKDIAIYPLEKAEAEFFAAASFGAEIISLTNPFYPPLLASIPDAPPIVTFKGNKNLLKNKMLAIVGTRRTSINGEKLAKKIAEDLKEAGYTIASGLALGIDTMAHIGAYPNTVAVLGCGIDVFYPPKNQKLQEDLMEKGGVLSEFPMGTEPMAGHFPRRNRIISGMSAATILIESEIKSGSLITARLAKEQGRAVFAVPGFPSDPHYTGNNKLIKEGAARMIENSKDILNALSDIPFSQKTDGFTFGPITPDEKEIADIRKILLEKLSATPILVSELIDRLSLPTSAVYVALLDLELAGLIERTGNRVSLIVQGKIDL